jgi:hypothetical protein
MLITGVILIIVVGNDRIEGFSFLDRVLNRLRFTVYLQILEGPSAEKARPILASTDRNLINEVATAIAQRLTERKAPARPQPKTAEAMSDE